MELNKKTEGIKLIAYLLFAIIILCVVFGCGSRKVNKYKTEIKETQTTEVSKDSKEEAKKESETNIKETKTTTIDESKNIVTEVTEIVPVDQTKEATFTDAKGQKYNLNNSKYRNEKTTDLSKEKTVSISEYNKLKKDIETILKIAEQRGKTIIELQKEIDTKESDRGFNYLSLWWILPLIAVCYFSYRKFKGLPLI